MPVSVSLGGEAMSEGRRVMDMVIEELVGGGAKVILRGRLDTTGAIAVEMPFNALAGERSALLVDLSGLEFMSSYGIRILLIGAKIMRSKGRHFALVCPDNHVLRVLNAARANQLFPIYPTTEAAVAALV